MEDPFSVLNVFVPDTISRPHVTPLYPASSGDEKLHPLEPILLALDHAFPSLNTVELTKNTYTSTSHETSSAVPPAKKRRHWTIIRNAGGRSRLKENEFEEATPPARATSRFAQTADWGTFAQLVGTLTTDPNPSRRASICENEQELHVALRSSVTPRPVTGSSHPIAQQLVGNSATEPVTGSSTGDDKVCSDEAAMHGWHYLLDVVYGGVDGFAYVRSLAEFLRRPPEFEVRHLSPSAP